MRPVIQGILAALVGMLVLVTLQMKGVVSLTDLKSLALMVAASLALIVFKMNLLWTGADRMPGSRGTFYGIATSASHISERLSDGQT